MAKRNTTTKRDKSGIIKREEQVKPTKVSVKRRLEIQSKPEMVVLRLRYPVKYNYQSLSGKRITWNGAGSMVKVSREDADILLLKYRDGCDCGSGSKRLYIFEEA